MNDTQLELQKIEDVLVPFRKNSVNNQVPAALAEKLLFAQVSKSTDPQAASHDDNIYFCKFFADALYLTDVEGSDRAGIENAFAGLEDVLVSVIEIVNSPLEFKKQLLAALKKFKLALIEYEDATASSKDTAVALTKAVPKKIKKPQKQINIIAYYLWDTRRNFFPPKDLQELFDESNDIEREAAFENNFEKLKGFFVRRKSLRYSDIAVAQVFERFIDVESKQNDEEDELSALLPPPYELFKQAFQNLKERWRKTCVAGYRATRIAVETPAPDIKRFAERSNKTAWVIASILKFASAETIERNDVLTNFDAGMTGDALRLCLKSRLYFAETTDELFRIGPYVVLHNVEYPWGFRRRSQKKRRSRKQEGKRLRNLLDPRGFKKTSIYDTKSKSPGAVDVSGGAWSDEIKREIAQGAALGEFDFTDEFVTVENAPPGSATESKAFRITGEEEVPSWGRARLTDEMLGVVWAWIKTQAETKQDELGWQAALAFTELLILLGFPPHILLAAVTVEGDGGEKSEITELNAAGASAKRDLSNKDAPILPVITYENDCLRIRPVRSGGESAFAKPVEDAQREYYMPSSSEFVISLPPAVNASLKKLVNARASATVKNIGVQKTRLVFSFFDEPSGKAIDLTERTLNRIYKSCGESVNEKITAAKIAKSARTLLREDGKLSNLEIALLSGETTHRVASSMFYTNFKVSTLLEKYSRCARRVSSNLVAESRAFVEHHEHLKIKPLDESALNDYSIDLSKISEDARVGSPFVPVPEKFAGYLNDLYEGAKKTSDFVLRHNRMTAFVALTLMALTGLRPMELSFITHSQLNLSSAASSMLPVIAKINQKHTEWRALEIAPETVEILRMYQSFSLETRRDSYVLTEFSRAEIDARLGDTLFFYLRRSLAPVKIITSGLLELVKDYSYLELPSYPWQLNSPRHLYRTTAVNELGVPERNVNALLGHQSAGVESLGLYSSYDRFNEAIFAREISRCIWNKLGLDYVR